MDAGADGEIVWRLGDNPLLLRIAAGTLREEALSASDYLASLAAHGLPAGAQLPFGDGLRRVVHRALEGLPASVRRTFLAIADQPGSLASSRAWAALLGTPEPLVSARLVRLARRDLLDRLPGGMYVMHPAVAEAARALRAAGLLP